MDSDADNYENPRTPPGICNASEEAAEKLLPKKSADCYRTSYNKFMAWKEIEETESFSERVLLAYFNKLSKTFKPTTLWSEFSKLKTMIYHYHKIDINYTDLKRFLKKAETNNDNHIKKAKTFSSEQIERFLNDAPDDQWLAIKVAAIFGFLGACRRAELRNISTDDLEVFYPDNDKAKQNPTLYVKIPNTKTNKPRSFTVEDEYFKIYKKYENLRSNAANGKKDFFLQFQKGKCSAQVIGINTFGGMPKKVAEFLKLDQPHSYTGHAWRRTSATLLVEGGADMDTLKRHGGWRSNTVAEGYIETSRNEKRKIYNRITSSINLNPSSSTPAATAVSTNSDIPEKENEEPPTKIALTGELTLHVNNCTNCTFLFNKKE